MSLHDASSWNTLRKHIPHAQSQNFIIQPAVGEFSDMLENLFRGHRLEIEPPKDLHEVPWVFEKCKVASKWFKCKRGADDAGLGMNF